MCSSYSATTTLTKKSENRYLFAFGVKQLRCYKCNKKINLGDRIDVRGRYENKRTYNSSCFEKLYIRVWRATSEFPEIRSWDGKK